MEQYDQQDSDSEPLADQPFVLMHGRPIKFVTPTLPNLYPEILMKFVKQRQRWPEMFYGQKTKILLLFVT